MKSCEHGRPRARACSQRPSCEDGSIEVGLVVASGDAEVEVDPAAAAAAMEAANMVTTLAMMPMPVNIEQGLVVTRKPAMRTDREGAPALRQGEAALQFPDCIVHQCTRTHVRGAALHSLPKHCQSALPRWSDA